MTKTPYEFFARFNPDGTVAGCTCRYQIWADGVLVKDGDPEPVNVNDAAFASFATAFSASALNQLDAANTAKQQAESEKETALSQLEAANARIVELEAQLNPPDPFPNADWAGFRAAALTDPAVQRVAAGNSVLWPVLFMYLSELSTNPARGKDIAWLWNTMESRTPVTTDEIQRVNAIAETHGVPLSMNAEGQIVLP
jgi:hypothetical protein